MGRLASGFGVAGTAMALTALAACGGGTSHTGTPGLKSVSAGAPGLSARVAPRACLRWLEQLAPGTPPAPRWAPAPASVIASYALFRTPARADDRPNGPGLAHGGVAGQLHRRYELASYYPAYIRRLPVVKDGRQYFVVPAFARVESPPPPRCTTPRRAFAPVSRFLRQQRRRAHEAVYCFVEVPESNVSERGCEPFAAAAAGGSMFEASDFLRRPLVELAPDGVAAVRIAYAGLRPVTVAVHDNAFAFTPPPAPPATAHLLAPLEDGASAVSVERWDAVLQATYPTEVQWLDGAGRVLRTIHRPARTSESPTEIGETRAPIGG